MGRKQGKTNLGLRCALLVLVLSSLASSISADPAKITVGASMTLTNNTNLQVEIGGNPADNNSPVTFDQIIITGSGNKFTVGGAKLTVTPLAGVVLHSPYPIVKATSGASVNFSKLFSNLTNGTSYSAPGVSYTVSYSSSEIDVTFSSVPEPATFGLSLIFASSILIRRRHPHAAGAVHAPTLRRVRK